MTRRVFYSFHYELDYWRAAQVRNIGRLECNRPATERLGICDQTWRHRNTEMDWRPNVRKELPCSTCWCPNSGEKVDKLRNRKGRRAKEWELLEFMSINLRIQMATQPIRAKIRSFQSILVTDSHLFLRGQSVIPLQAPQAQKSTTVLQTALSAGSKTLFRLIVD